MSGINKRMEKLTRQCFCQKCGGSGRVQVATGSALRARRESAGLSLRQLAERMKFSVPYLADVERERRNCTQSILNAYASLKPKSNGTQTKQK